MRPFGANLSEDESQDGAKMANLAPKMANLAPKMANLAPKIAKLACWGVV